MDELERLRNEIDAIDAEMAALFEQRMHLVGQIAEEKRRQKLPILNPAREQAVLAQNETRLTDPALADYWRDWMRHTMALSREWQRRKLLAAAETKLIPVTLENGYEIVLRRGFLRGWPINAPTELLDLNRRVLVVTDAGVPAEYAASVAARCKLPTVVTVPQGEGSKSVAVWQSLLQTMQQNGFTRDDCVLALGGGMVCDLAGFAAASYLRGIDSYTVPTTLLAMIDASFGGKTALNLGGAKNQIGAFSQPKRVLIDPDTLQTLPRRHIANGLAEALKIAVCFDPALFALFEEQDLLQDPTPVIEPCIRHKLRLVMEDERETGVRKLLNFGHTLGHAIEAETGLLHGEAVALGMLPMCGEPVRKRLLPIYERLGLATETDCDIAALTERLRRDKKSHGDTIDIVFAPEIGRAEIQTISFAELEELWKKSR